MLGGRWEHIPWAALREPEQVWRDQPTFVIGEFLMIAGALIALAHAYRHGRLHLLLWLCSLIAGSANDAFFMWIPIVDNFWQAQASIMMSAADSPPIPHLPPYWGRS